MSGVLVGSVIVGCESVGVVCVQTVALPSVFFEKGATPLLLPPESIPIWASSDVTCRIGTKVAFGGQH